MITNGMDSKQIYDMLGLHGFNKLRILCKVHVCAERYVIYRKPPRDDVALR